MRILPKPVEAAIGNGTLTFDSLSVFFCKELEGAEKSVFTAWTEFRPSRVTEQACATALFHYDGTLTEGAYRLTVNERIAVYAGTESGAYYAAITVAQLYDRGLPYCTVNDRPRFSHRGIMLDVARHYFGKEAIKQLLDNMAYYKLNVFHWHLTEDQGWRIEIKTHPLLAQKGSIRSHDWLNGLNAVSEEPYGEGCYFTQEDVKEIVRYAAERYITVIPEIDMPGHLTAALSVYPELSCEGKPIEVSTKWGIKDTVGCIGNPDFIKFTHEILDELCELFPSPYFHIGGDEVPKTKWKSCPKCQAFMKEHKLKNEDNLQGWFTNQTVEYLAKKGKITVGWNEILSTEDLRRDIVVQWWKGKKEPLEWLARGGKAVLSQCLICYMDYPYILTNLEKIYKLGPEVLNVPQEYVKNVNGIEAPLWTEFVYDKKKMDFMIYPRLQAVAEAAWTPYALKNYHDFTERLAYFFPHMEKQGIRYCPPSKYNPVGLRGLAQKWYVGRKFMKDPNCEVNK